MGWMEITETKTKIQCQEKYYHASEHGRATKYTKLINVDSRQPINRIQSTLYSFVVSFQCGTCTGHEICQNNIYFFLFIDVLLINIQGDLYLVVRNMGCSRLFEIF